MDADGDASKGVEIPARRRHRSRSEGRRAIPWKCSQSSQSRRQSHGSPGSGIPSEKGPLSEVKDDLSRYLREAEVREVVITRHGKPAGVLIGFASEDDWFDYRLENDARFLARLEKARESVRAGQGVRLEDSE